LDEGLELKDIKYPVYQRANVTEKKREVKKGKKSVTNRVQKCGRGWMRGASNVTKCKANPIKTEGKIWWV